MDNIKDSPYVKLVGDAAAYRLFSLVFQPPHPDLPAQIAALGREVRGPAAELPKACGSMDTEEYHFILGPAGGCSPCESEYLGDKLGGKGSLMADVAGFYDAFSFPRDADTQERVDHIAVELSFMSFLLLKTAYAAHRGNAPGVNVCADAGVKFAKTHLLPWLNPFRERLDTVAPGSFYARAATVMCGCLPDGFGTGD